MPARRPPSLRKTVAEIVRGRRAELTPAELRVAQALLADYPAAGLQPVAALAAHAGVSGPTVVRLVAKLGLAGYADLQSRLRSELSARAAGPVQRYAEAAPTGAANQLLRRFERRVAPALTQSLRDVDAVEFDSATALLAEAGRPVLLTGGRVSSMLALYLARSLSVLRPDVRLIEPDRAARAGALMDITARTTVVAFDYRRYDDDIADFGRSASAAGAAVVLLTDNQLSPLAASATVLLTTSTEGPPPFITLTPAVALVEAMVLAVMHRIGAPARRRLARFDALSADPSSGVR